MRSEKEMLDLILGVARKDERIRAVYMNGSRTNKNAKPDIFQDYDIVYVVKENKPFYTDESWIDIFGERLYMQCPDQVDLALGKEVDFDSCYGWLMQFSDGNRLDLHVVPLAKADVTSDKLCVILLDKDGILPKIPEATDEDYRVKRPNQQEFWACCNEFWWCLNNVAKGLWREEIPYVHNMLYTGSHPQLVKLLNWKVGFETGFSVSTGKSSKYLNDFLSADVWSRFLKTYAGGTVDEMWESVFTMCDLFNETAKELEKNYGYLYDSNEAEASCRFLKHVRTLPKTAMEIF